MTRMNIVFFSCVDFPEGDATSSRVRLLSKTIIEAGNHVHLAIFNPNAKSIIKQNKNINGSFEGIDFTYLNGSTVRPSDVVGAIKDTAKGVFKSVPFLLRKILQKKLDVIIFYTPNVYLIMPSLVIAKLFRIPVILELCEINSSGKHSGIKAKIKMLGARATDRFLPSFCDGVIAISLNIISFLKNQRTDGKKILHIPVLVEFAKLEKKSDAVITELTDRKYFLNSGTLGEKDGVEFIVRAFNLICKTHRDILLVFTGKHSVDKHEEIYSFAEPHIRKNIIFTGYLDTETLIWAYQNAEGLLCCRSNSQYANYGFPTKLAEYLASGRPVITNEVGDVNLYLKHLENAFITISENPESIAEAMQLMLQNPALAKIVGLAGQRVARDNFYYINHVEPVRAFLSPFATRLGMPN